MISRPPGGDPPRIDRLPPDRFVLPGELPPLLIDDTVVEAGLRGKARAGRRPVDGIAHCLPDEVTAEAMYDLGVAYQGVGRVDVAMAAFQMALKSPARRLSAYEAMGHCLEAQGRHEEVVRLLTGALVGPGHSDEQLVGVRYLLGTACMAVHRFAEARRYFQQVYATDMDFRDVAARLAVLQGAR